LDFANLFGVRTAVNAPALPNRVYIESFNGIQKRDGYYLSSTQTEPTGDFVWQGPYLSREYYNMTTDALQMDNLLYNLQVRPDKEKIMKEASLMKFWLSQLITCHGEGCQLAEN
jgi:hypothetical protein